MKKTGADASRAAAAWNGPPAAVLWTQSLVWGLLCIDALSMLEVPFEPISAQEIREGCLDKFRVLIVPGGWAAHKARALGEAGASETARFLDEGGSYLGICGGAGLALSSPPALNLTPIRRMPVSDRLPSASGRIHVSGTVSHPAWRGIPPRIPVSIWWPSQFEPDLGRARLHEPCAPACLASYLEPGAGFQVADMRVSDIAGERACWTELERTYGINLDPERIRGRPAIIEARRGKGRLILSYAHLETPGDRWGNRLFLNILHYLNELSTGRETFARGPAAAAGPLLPAAPKGEDLDAGSGGEAGRTAGLPPGSGSLRAKRAAWDLIAFGEANLFWNWRKPWLLNWRRGVRGLEYGTLYIMLCRMVEVEKKQGKSLKSEELEEKTLEFCALSKRLLFEEKIAAAAGRGGKPRKADERVDRLRSSLFGDKMSPGGLCGELFDLIDVMLLDLIRRQ